MTITNSDIVAVLTRGTGQKSAIQKKVIEKLPDGTMSNGVIMDAANVAASLEKIRTATKVTHVVICVPPQQVFCVNFSIAPAPGKSFRELVETAMEEHIPENRAALQYQTKQLSRAKGRTHIGVIAMRKDAIATLQAVAQKAGLIVHALTTAPCLLAESVLSSGNAYAIVACAIPGQQQTVTLFHGHWPIDEALLPAETSVEDLLAEAASMQTEYKAEGVNVEQIFFFPGVPLPKDAPAAHAVEDTLRWMKDVDPSLGPSALASVTVPSLSLLGPQRSRWTYAIVLGCIALIALVAAAAFAIRSGWWGLNL